MNSIDILKEKRARCEKDDLCFFSEKFIVDPKEMFHPLIGFVSVSKINEKLINEVFKKYENKHKDKSN